MMLDFVWNLAKPTRQLTASCSQVFSLSGSAPIRQWLNAIEIRNAALAHLLCRVIPTQCPFERDIRLLGYTLFHIPPLCKLNPLYEEIMSLRFRALCYLADECGEDIGCYC
jgi:hypothetical protein